MLVLLPPSEGKSSGGDGPPVDLAALSWPSLTDTRRLVADRLVTLCATDPVRARDVLGLSEALDPDRAADAALWTSPTRPAGERYTGVLYDALGYATLPAAARRRADRSLVTFSGVWGAVRPTDALPAYRLGIGTRLPDTTGLPALWHRPLATALDPDVVAEGALDLRSSGYRQMWRPTGEAAERVVAVELRAPNGRSAISYVSKLAKGALVRAMLRRGVPTARQLLAAAAELGLAAAAADRAVTVVVPADWRPPG